MPYDFELLEDVSEGVEPREGDCGDQEDDGFYVRGVGCGQWGIEGANHMQSEKGVMHVSRTWIADWNRRIEGTRSLNYLFPKPIYCK